MNARGWNWRRKAVCFLETSSTPELWTPDRQPARAVRESLEGLCHRCPVRRQCAADAIEGDAEGGLFAGVWIPERGDRAKWDAAIERLCEIAGSSEHFGVEFAELEASA